MRILKFIVSGQNIQPDPSCDFAGIFPGTEGYLMASFLFDDTWSGCGKIAEFRKYYTSEPVPVKLTRDACMIPSDVLTGKTFKVSVVGIRPGFRIKTDITEVKQNG